MPLEEAIVALVVQGSAQVAAEADRINADLTALERGAKRAEDAAGAAERAAKNAEKASRELTSSIQQTLGKLGQAAQLARKLGSFAGVEKDSKLGLGLDAFGDALSGASAGASLGAVAGPWGAAAGALGGGLLGGLGSLREAEKRIAEQNRRVEEQEQKRLAKERDERLVEALLREVGLHKLDNGTFGPRQVP